MGTLLERLTHLGKKHRAEADREEPNRIWSELDEMEIHDKLHQDALWQEVSQTAGLETSPVTPEKALLIYRNAFLTVNTSPPPMKKVPTKSAHIPETHLEAPSYDSCYADDDEFEIQPLMSKNI